MRCLLRVLLLVGVLFVSIPAMAVPVTYGLTIGTITIQANQTSDNALIFNQTLSLSTNSFVVWDQFGVPAAGVGGTMEDFLLDVVSTGSPHPLESGQTYGPFDLITIESGVIQPDFLAGFSTLLTFPSGSSFLTQVGAIGIEAFYSASNSTTGDSTPGPVEADIATPNNMNGTITFTGGSIQVVMDSIVMGTVDGTPFGEAGNDLILTANINFFGASNVVPTPEPSTAMLLALGLFGMAASRRRLGRKR